MKIIHKEADGSVTIIHPSPTEINPATGNVFTTEEIAKKDVPTGAKYKIVSVSDLPTDRSFRNAWVVNESDLTDGVGE